MADVMQQHVNGHESHFMHDDDRSALYDEGHGGGDEERMRELLRSKEFREQVGEIVQEQLERGAIVSNSTTSPAVTEVPSRQQVYRVVLPVSDIRGVDTLNYRKGEKMLRCKLASTYRLLSLHIGSGITDTIISARNGTGQMLIAPAGLLPGEVTASSLVKVDTTPGAGGLHAVLDDGGTALEPSQDEIALHSAVYAARQSINCVLHVASVSTVAVSVLRCGLLPLSLEAMTLTDSVAYLDYSGSASDPEQAADIQQALSNTKQVLFLRSFGALVAGETIEEAYGIAANLVTACDVQASVIGVGVENLHLPSSEVQETVYSTHRDIPQGVNPGVAAQGGYGVVEFEGLMRRLDHEGHCTGHVYLDPSGGKLQRSVSAADYTSGKTSVLDDRARDVATPLSMLLMRGKRPEWVVSPNSYRRREDQDSVDYSATTGSLKAKKKTVARWVSVDEETSTNRPKLRSASMKNISPNKFAPQGANPNELRQKVKEIRKEYFDDTITAGPQSTVLEGVTWEEAQRIKEGQMVNGVDNVRVTAASRGVIQREHQRDALFYKKYALNNPFDNVTEEELEKYKREVQRKSKKAAYGKYAESEPEFPSEGRYTQPTPEAPRALTPPPKPARLSPTPAQQHELSNSYSKSYEDEALTSGSVRPAQASLPQGKPAPLSPQNASTENNVTKEKDLPKRSQSARYPNERRPDPGNRSVLLDAPSGHSATLDNRSSKENSPAKDGTLPKDKKKKRGLRLPSFSKKKEKQ